MGSVPNRQSNTTSTEQPTTGEETETLQGQIEQAVQNQQVLRPRREKRQPRRLDDCILDLIKV